VQDGIIPLFQFGGEASVRGNQAPSQSATEFSPSFAVCGGRLLLVRGGNQGAFSAHDRILPLFCSVGGEASSREGWKPRCLLARKDQNTTIIRVLCLSFLCFLFSGIILSTSTVSTFTNGSNMDTDPATTPGNNTEDALVESSPIGTQDAPNDDDYTKIPTGQCR